MTHKDKAEAYVRKQLPELMELAHFVEQGNRFGTHVDYLHSIQLQHWLRVLEENEPAEYSINLSGQLLTYAGEIDDNRPGFRVAFGKKLHFNMTTGQPATEADYQAFNQIVGI